MVKKTNNYKVGFNMMQFYFLSIISNLLVGAMLVFEKQTSEIIYLKNKNIRFIIGIVTAVIGFVKLFVVTSVPVFGDFIPVISGLAGGFTLILEYCIEKSTINLKSESFINKLFVVNKRTVGIICLGSAALHFVFPNILFL